MFDDASVEDNYLEKAQSLGAKLDRAVDKITQLESDVSYWRARYEDSERRLETWKERCYHLERTAAGHVLHFAGLTTVTTRAQLLPAEIVAHICKYAAVPHFASPTLADGPRSIWFDNVRILKNMALVCKSWNPTATTLLYHDVVLRRIGQIAALLRTLRDVSSLRGLVHKISLSGVTMETPPVFIRLFLDIVYLCPALRRLALLGPSECAFTQLVALGLQYTRMSLSHLQIGLTEPCGENLSIFTTTLGQLTGVVHLNFMHDWKRFPMASLPSLTFPVLETFIYYQGYSGPLSEEMPEWTMPRLRQLTTWSYGAGPLAFLQRNGENLRYLWVRNGSHNDYLALLSSCPVLEHLVLHFNTVASVLSNRLHHPSLRWIDVWTRSRHGVDDTPADARKYERECLAQLFSSAATLRMWNGHIRLLDRKLFIFPDLPTSLHPSLVVEDEEIRHTISNYVVLQSASGVWMCKPQLLDDDNGSDASSVAGSEDNHRLDSQERYSETSSYDSDETYSYISQDTEGDWTSRDEDEEEDEEDDDEEDEDEDTSQTSDSHLDLETILDIFKRTIDD